MVDSKNSILLLNIAKIIATVLLALALLIASNFPGDGSYQINIYQVYPPLFWILLTTIIGIGLTMSLWHVFIKPDSYAWIVGIILIVLTNGLVLLLQTLRHYGFTTQWDDVNHFSSIIAILNYQQPDVNNFYPTSHLLAVNFSLITNINPDVTMLLFTVLFYLIYLSNIIFLSWTIHARSDMRGLMLVLAVPLVFGTYSTIFRPTHFTVYMIPLFIGWFYLTRFQESNPMHTVPFLLLLAIFPFLHPWAVVSGIVLIFMFSISTLKRSFGYFRDKTNLFLNPLLLLGITWLTWFMTFNAFGNTLKEVTESFVKGLTGSESFFNYLAAAERASIPLARIASLIAFSYGHALFYFIPVGIVLFWVLLKLYNHDDKHIPVYFLAMTGFITLFASLAVISVFRKLMTDNPLRLLNIAITAVPLFVSGGIISIRSLTKFNRYLLFNSLLICLWGGSIFGLFSTYTSPIIGLPNTQYSYAEQAGVKFLLANFNRDDKNIYGLGSLDWVLGSVLPRQEIWRLKQQFPQWSISKLPGHFGYEEYFDELYFENPGYFWLTGFDETYYKTVWPDGGRLTPNDFDKLAQDPNWHQIYTTGNDLTIWRINSEHWDKQK